MLRIVACAIILWRNQRVGAIDSGPPESHCGGSKPGVAGYLLTQPLQAVILSSSDGAIESGLTHVSIPSVALNVAR